MIDGIRKFRQKLSGLLNTMFMNQSLTEEHADARVVSAMGCPTPLENLKGFLGVALFKAEFSKKMDAQGIGTTVAKEVFGFLPVTQKVLGNRSAEIVLNLFNQIFQLVDRFTTGSHALTDFVIKVDVGLFVENQFANVEIVLNFQLAS